ncbi:MAG: manganese transporter [Cellvibrionales bacterium]|nr:MAG: manganese transporter [Cellvibrionales bacterium]
MSGPSIQCQQLGLRLGGVEILSAIDLTIPAAEIHCVIGPNGGGKTSFVRSLLGQMPHSGKVEITWDSAPGSKQKNTIGYVPQFLDFDKSLPISVYDFMAMICNTSRPAFAGFSRGKRELTETALERVGLKGKSKTQLGNLSGGERQRMLFAQALIPQPELLILDEPMTSLDNRGEEIFLSLIEELRSQGVTIIWIAHDLQQVRELASTISCINRTLVYAGPPQPFLDSDEAAKLFRFTRPAADTAPAQATSTGAVL